MPLSPAAKKQSDLVKANIKRISGAAKSKLSLQQQRAIRKRIKEGLTYLDAHAIKLGDTNADIVEVLGPPYGTMPPNDWLYPGEDRDYFYRLNFAAGRVAVKQFVFILDLETGR